MKGPGTILFESVNRSVDTTPNVFVRMGIGYLIAHNFIRGFLGSFATTKHL